MTDIILNIRTKSRQYPMILGHRLRPQLGSSLLARGLDGDVVVVTDTNVAKRYLRETMADLRSAGLRTHAIVLSPGERQKTLRTAEGIVRDMIGRKVGRDGTVVALGGGVIGDLAGFVAATYHRGIALVHVPTTLLAQVDSAIGGKVGVNHTLGKNLVGAFHQPHLVWADTARLGTLPRRELVCGLGEVVKYGILTGGTFFAWLERNIDRLLDKDPDALTFVVRTGARLKAEICRRDETERGMRINLNLGHTIAHALEAAGNYRGLRHGEAVLLGLRVESDIARQRHLLSEKDHRRIVRLLDLIPVPAPPSKLAMNRILKNVSRDKKSLGGVVRYVLPRRLGSVSVVGGVDSSAVRRALKRSLQ